MAPHPKIMAMRNISLRYVQATADRGLHSSCSTDREIERYREIK